MYKIQRYTAEDKLMWDEFVRNSRNGTFLLTRGYVDYHADRFEDCSLMAYRKDKLYAILPANINGDTLYSHGGLTYGGILLATRHIDGSDLLQIFEAIISWCNDQGIKHLIYKPIPFIYHNRPSQEDLYALFRLAAERIGCNLSSTVCLSEEIRFDMSKRQQMRKADSMGLVLKETDDYSQFWQILEQCLLERHDAKPVHSLQEIQMLHNLFPQNIRLHTVSDEDGIQAGIVIFDTGICAHSQYTASTPKARKGYYVTWLYHKLMTEVYSDRQYFDFGTSNGDGGHYLDDGLLRQKFSLGGTGVVYETYKLSIK